MGPQFNPNCQLYYIFYFRKQGNCIKSNILACITQAIVYVPPPPTNTTIYTGREYIKQLPVVYKLYGDELSSNYTYIKVLLACLNNAYWNNITIEKPTMLTVAWSSMALVRISHQIGIFWAILKMTTKPA